MENFISKSVNETEEIAKKLSKKLKFGDVVIYKGGLGVGKTAFTRGLAAGLNISCEVTSPTFALVHEYRGKPFSLFHFDMYRVDNINDLYSTGFFDYLDENQIIAIEWSENIEDILLQNEISPICVTLDIIDDNTRKITIDGGEQF